MHNGGRAAEDETGEAATGGWRVFGRAIGWGTMWGGVFGALAGLPLMLVGAIPGTVIGAGAGFVCALTPALALVAYAPELRRDLVQARFVAGVGAAGPVLLLALVWRPGEAATLALLACAAAAGITAAILARRILDGPRRLPGVVVGDGEPYRESAA